MEIIVREFYKGACAQNTSRRSEAESASGAKHCRSVKRRSRAGRVFHPNVVGRLERGIYNPTVLTLSAIAETLRLQLRQLV